MNRIKNHISILILICITMIAAPLTSCSGKVHSSMAPNDLEKLFQSGNVPVILDVRSPKEYSSGHIPGAINIPYNKLQERLSELAPHKKEEIVVYCRSGRRTGIAMKILQEAGFEQLISLEGQMPAWKSAGLPVTE